LVAVVGCVLVGSRHVWAGNGHPDRRWHSSDELFHGGELQEPQSILEARFLYDAETTPSLHLEKLHVKRGYAPTYEPLSSGYVLSLHAANGDTLSSLTFQIPNVVFNPPPLPGETAEHGPTVLTKTEFAITVALPDGAVELRVTDPQGVLIIQEPLEHAQIHDNQPNFRSFRQQSGSSGSPMRHRSRFAGLFDWFMETAEAATLDGTALDVTFVGDNYTSADLTLFHQDVDRAIAHLLTYEPYASRQAQVLFHTVDNTTVDLGCYHDASITRLILCNDATVVSVVNSAGAPYDKIIVIVKDSSYGGSGGSTVAVSYNGSSEPQVIVHEFGHTFGGLKDEYNLYSSNGSVTGATYANCYAGTPPNAQWDGLASSSDYTLGCTYPNWYRGSPCSIMLQLSCQYHNAVSRALLDDKLDLYAGSTDPSLTLTANPSTIAGGGSSTLTWSAANVSGCTASGAWSGTKPLSGSEAVVPAATATYTLSCGSLTQSVAVTVDAQPPATSVTSPSDGSTVSGTVTVSASASDDAGVSRVDFYKDGALLGSDNSAPYSLKWDTAKDAVGSHTLNTTAFDVAGNLANSAPVSVTVQSAVKPGKGGTKRR
jgi:hypothetical protein